MRMCKRESDTQEDVKQSLLDLTVRDKGVMYLGFSFFFCIIFLESHGEHAFFMTISLTQFLINDFFLK